MRWRPRRRRRNDVEVQNIWRTATEILYIVQRTLSSEQDIAPEMRLQLEAAANRLEATMLLVLFNEVESVGGPLTMFPTYAPAEWAQQ